jgi:hypothetical protein
VYIIFEALFDGKLQGSSFPGHQILEKYDWRGTFDQKAGSGRMRFEVGIANINDSSLVNTVLEFVFCRHALADDPLRNRPYSGILCAPAPI